MKLEDIYRTAVQAGRDADPRGKERIEKELAAVKKEYDELKEKDREFFDLERLTNPYADTRILNGAPETEVQTIIVGIDMEVGELVLADRLREKRRLDLVLTHHPEGRALAKLGDVMGMQADILHSVGVPIATAEALLNTRIGEVSRRLLPVNHTRAVDAARLLGLPFMCVHTPGDNQVVVVSCRGSSTRSSRRRSARWSSCCWRSRNTATRRVSASRRRSSAARKRTAAARCSST